MKEKVKQIFLKGLFYFSLILVVLFFMAIYEPKCVHWNTCMSEDAYYSVFAPAIIVFILFIIDFIKKRFFK